MDEAGTQTRIMKLHDVEAQAKAITQANECQTDIVELGTPLQKSNHQKDSILADTSITQKKHNRKSEATAHLAPILNQGSVASSVVADPSSIDQTFGLKYQVNTDEGMEVGAYRVQNDKIEDSLSTNQNETLPRTQNFQFREEFSQQ